MINGKIDKVEFNDADFQEKRNQLWALCHINVTRYDDSTICIGLSEYPENLGMQIIIFMISAAKNALYLQESEGADFD